MLLGGVSEQSPPLLGDALLLLGEVETVADRLSPLAVLVLPPPLAEAVICIQLMASDLCSPPLHRRASSWKQRYLLCRFRIPTLPLLALQASGNEGGTERGLHDL